MSSYRGVHRPGRRRRCAHAATIDTPRPIRARVEQTAPIDAVALAQLLARPCGRHAETELLAVVRPGGGV